MGLGDEARPKRWAMASSPEEEWTVEQLPQLLFSLTPTLHVRLTPLRRLVVSLTAYFPRLPLNGRKKRLCRVTSAEATRNKIVSATCAWSTVGQTANLLHKVS